MLNTNTRYLHDALVRYARRLADTLPDPLSVVFLTNSGSEANDLALRLARAHTGGRDMLVLDHAYHGNLTSLVDLSPVQVRRVLAAAAVRRRLTSSRSRMPTEGRWGASRSRTSPPCVTCSARVTVSRPAGRRVPERADAGDGRPGRPRPGLPRARRYDEVRAAGGVCIADEVQIGFGRVGAHFWGFELHGVVPDIVTMGKPIGNGHPMGAVVTTPEVARSFANGMEYFNTFGGNPVSARVGLAVLDVLEDEGLQAHAAAARRVAARRPRARWPTTTRWWATSAGTVSSSASSSSTTGRPRLLPATSPTGSRTPCGPRAFSSPRMVRTTTSLKLKPRW